MNHLNPFPQVKTIQEQYIEQAQRILTACYEMENGINLYGQCPNPDFTPAFKKAKARAFAWIKENKREYLFEAMKFICGGAC